jgi:serine/threonine-protein kinase ATR
LILLDSLSPNQLYLALSQLLSRITHSDKDVLDVIMLFIVEIAKRYPRQALWSIYRVVNSRNKDRNFLGKEIVLRLRANTSDELVNSLLATAAHFTENMIKICNFNVEGQKIQISLSRDVGYNKSMVPCDLVVPVQSAMQVVLPSLPEDLRNHIPFPDEVTVAGKFYFLLVASSLTNKALRTML